MTFGHFLQHRIRNIKPAKTDFFWPSGGNRNTTLAYCHLLMRLTYEQINLICISILALFYLLHKIVANLVRLRVLVFYCCRLQAKAMAIRAARVNRNSKVCQKTKTMSWKTLQRWGKQQSWMIILCRFFTMSDPFHTQIVMCSNGAIKNIDYRK